LTTHTFNVINISEYHHSQGGGSVHADFSLLGQKWVKSGMLFIQYICLYGTTHHFWFLWLYWNHT